MDVLSLNEPPELPERRLTRSEAVGLSVLLHALVVLLLIFLPGHLPDIVVRLLGPRPRTVIAEANADAMRVPPLVKPKPPSIPLKFTYVKIPNDVAGPKNPRARLLSDKDRKARQEVPTPPDAKRFTADPHSKGTSPDRVRPDPRLKEGPDEPAPVLPEPPRIARLETPGTGRASTEGPGSSDTKAGSAGGDPAGGQAPEERRQAADDIGSFTRPPGGEGGGQDAAVPGSGGPGEAEPGGASLSSPPDMKEGTEFKFRFDNQGWLRGGAYGTLSFDTQGFPWGDYARQIYVIIRNNWLPRIPLAAREGLADYTCQHFIIQRRGAIAGLTVTRVSRVPPFDRAASDALNASSPLPPLPRDFPDPQEGATFCFFYNMLPGEVR